MDGGRGGWGRRGSICGGGEGGEGVLESRENMGGGEAGREQVKSRGRVGSAGVEEEGRAGWAL